MNSKLDVDAVLREGENKKKMNVMRSNTINYKDDSSEECPEDHWADLPDPIEKKNVKLTKKQRVFEAELITGILKHWDEIFKVAVKKKARKIILSKDEYSINYDVKNRRELILPPEYYLNLTDLEKYYLENYKGKDPNWDVLPLRMYLGRRYEIKSDLIHLSNIAKFCNTDMVNLFKKKFKPYQNKLLAKVKKRIKMRNARKKVEVSMPKRIRNGSIFDTKMASKIKSQGVKKFVVTEEKPKPTNDEIKEKENEEEDKISNISDNQSERISILDLIILINRKVENLSHSFDQFAKKNKQGKGFMNIFAFNSFMGVALGLKLSSANKRGLFTVIDWNDDGYTSIKEFLKVFATTEEDIQKAILNPVEYNEGLILNFVIEQIYHDIIMFKTESLRQIEEKLDSKGFIEIDRLEKYLGFYNCKLTPIEKQLLAGAGTKDENTGKIMVPFLKLVEKSITT